MFSYLRTKSSFLEEKAESIAAQLETFVKHSVRYGIRKDGEKMGVCPKEKQSWVATVESLQPLLKDEAISPDVLVGMEIFSEAGKYTRADVMLAGQDRQGQRKILVLEFKQWELLKLRKRKGKKVICFYKDRIPDDPAEQVRDYCEEMREVNSAVGNGKVQLIPAVVLPKCDRTSFKEAADLLEAQGMPVFWKGQEEKLKEFIRTELDREGRYDNDTAEVLSAGQPAASLMLHEKIGALLAPGRGPWIKLREDQWACKEGLLKKIFPAKEVGEEDGGPSVLRISGGPGSGKSLIALQLLKECLTAGLSVRYVLPVGAPLYAYVRDAERAALGREGLFVSATALAGEPDGSLDVILVDEAQNLYPNTARQLCKKCRPGGTILCFYDKLQATIEDKNELTDGEPHFQLDSQFRCNYDEGYVTFVDDLLYGTEKYPLSAETLDFTLRLIPDTATLKRLAKDPNTVVTAGPWADGMEELSFGAARFPAYGERFLEEPFIIGHCRDGVQHFAGAEAIKGLEAKRIIVIIGYDLGFDEEAGLLRADPITLNKYRILLTRGMQSCHLYCPGQSRERKALRRFLTEERKIRTEKGGEGNAL